MRSLELLLCRILAAQRPAGDVLVDFLEVAGLRYSGFLNTVRELVVEALHGLGIDAEPRDVENVAVHELPERVAEILAERGEGRLYRARTTRELARLRDVALRVLRVAALAAADMYNISCPAASPTQHAPPAPPRRS